MSLLRGCWHGGDPQPAVSITASVLRVEPGGTWELLADLAFKASLEGVAHEKCRGLSPWRAGLGEVGGNHGAEARGGVG